MQIPLPPGQGRWHSKKPVPPKSTNTVCEANEREKSLDQTSRRNATQVVCYSSQNHQKSVAEKIAVRKRFLLFPNTAFQPKQRGDNHLHWPKIFFEVSRHASRRNDLRVPSKLAQLSYSPRLLKLAGKGARMTCIKRVSPMIEPVRTKTQLPRSVSLCRFSRKLVLCSNFSPTAYACGFRANAGSAGGQALN